MSDLNNKQQVRAIVGVAKLSFKIAPGAVLFKLGGAILDAVLPIVITSFAALTTTALVAAYSGDQAAGHRTLVYVGITAGLGFVMTLWRSLDNYIQAKMRYLVEARVSDHMYAHFLALDFWRYDDKDTVDLYERANKFSQFFAWIFERLARVVAEAITAVSAIIALAFFQPLLALAVFVALTPGVVLQFRLSRKQVAHWNENLEIRRQRDYIEYNFGQPKMISELRLYGLVQYLMGLMRKLRDQDEKGRLDFERRFIPTRIATDALEALVELGSLLWIVLQIAAHKHPVGQFIYVQQMVQRAMNGVSMLASTLGNIDEDIAFLFDYQQFMDLPTVKPGGIKLAQTPKVIEFRNVSFAYPGAARNALENISLTIHAHEHVAIVGENGAGKSTFVKLLAGLYKPTSGSVLVDGIDLQEVNAESWHKYLGVLQQDFIHYNFTTAGENVRYGDVDGDYSDARMATALQSAEAEKFTAKLPKGLDTYVNNWIQDADGNKGTELSGGQWQRLALARDFYRNAPIIILDEPTSALDALAESRIFKRLFDDEQRTLITISHRQSTIKRASTIYMFEDGRLVESGTDAELFAAKKSYYNLFKDVKA